MDLLRSIKVALRAFLHEPTFTLAFVLTLGLGIGANTAIFSLVYGVLLRPLPYPEADRIVYLENAAKGAGIENMNFSFPEVADYREQVGSLDQIVEFGDWTFNVVGRGEPHRAIAGLVTANFFEVLGMRPILGRVLQPEDRQEGAPPVAVLTYEYWQRTLGGDPNVVGQKLDSPPRWRRSSAFSSLAPTTQPAAGRTSTPTTRPTTTTPAPPWRTTVATA